MTFPLDRYIADGVRRVKADPQGDLVWFTDAEFNERQAREQTIRDCIAALPHDTQCIDLWYDDKISECCCESRVAERYLRALLDETP